MPPNDEWTIGRLLTWTTDFLKQHDCDSPRLDAELLLAEAIGCERIELYTSFGEPAEETARVAFRELVRRRADGSPVAYLLGRAEFYSKTFRVTPAVLIPRPETEFVLVELFDNVKKYGVKKYGVKENSANRSIDIVDVGCGSGVLAICAALHLPDARVTALDISPKALDVARENAKVHNVESRINFLESDLFSALADGMEFDFIISNPPYVSESEYNELPIDVREAEPRVALIAGEHGDSVIRRLAPEAASRLRPGGSLICEMSPMIAGRVKDIFTSEDGFRDYRVVRDLAGCDRIAVVTRT